MGGVGSGSGVGALVGELGGSSLTGLGLQVGLQAPTKSMRQAGKAAPRHHALMLVVPSVSEPIAYDFRYVCMNRVGDPHNSGRCCAGDF